MTRSAAKTVAAPATVGDITRCRSRASSCRTRAGAPRSKTPPAGRWSMSSPSPRMVPPRHPSTSALPPPTPAHLAPAVAAAFDPLNRIPSSSSSEVDFELPHAGFSPISRLKVDTTFPKKAGRPVSPARGRDPTPHVLPRSIDLHFVSPREKAPAASVLSPVEDVGTPGSRSPPRADSPSLTPSAPSVGDGDSSEEEVESGEETSAHSDEETVDSSVGSDLTDWEGRMQALEVWLPWGRSEVAARLAFASLSPRGLCQCRSFHPRCHYLRAPRYTGGAPPLVAWRDASPVCHGRGA
jgi:hypothetical protein